MQRCVNVNSIYSPTLSHSTTVRPPHSTINDGIVAYAVRCITYTLFTPTLWKKRMPRHSLCDGTEKCWYCHDYILLYAAKSVARRSTTRKRHHYRYSTRYYTLSSALCGLYNGDEMFACPSSSSNSRVSLCLRVWCGPNSDTRRTDERPITLTYSSILFIPSCSLYCGMRNTTTTNGDMRVCYYSNAIFSKGAWHRNVCINYKMGGQRS